MNQAVLSLLKESKHAMRIDLIGVAGSGMSGLASMLLALGHKVSGSDKVTTVETERLEKAGLMFFSPHSDKEVEDCDMVIYSSAIKPGNIAYEAAYKQAVGKRGPVKGLIVQWLARDDKDQDEIGRAHV